MDHTHYTTMYPYGQMPQQLPPIAPQMIMPSTMLPSPHHVQSSGMVYLPQSPSHQSPHHLLHQMTPNHQQLTPNQMTPNHQMAMQLSNLQNLQNTEPITPVKEKNDKSSPMLYPMLYKTKMCKFHLLGVCEKGENCPHAHNSDEKRSRPDLSKTSLCRQLVENGRCDNQNCSFAHTKEELRATPNFFKMKKCKFFHSAQGCSFGEQCRYSHSADADSIVSPSHCGHSPSASRSISSIAGPSLDPYFRENSFGRWKGHFLRNRQMDLRVIMDVVGDSSKVERDIGDFGAAFMDIKILDLTYRVSIPEVNTQLENRRIICLKVVPASDDDAPPFAEYIDYYQKRQRAGAAVMPNHMGPLYVLPVSLALQVKVLDNNTIASIGSLMESRTNRQFLVGLWVCGDSI